MSLLEEAYCKYLGCGILPTEVFPLLQSATEAVHRHKSEMSEPTPALVASVHTDLPLPAGVTTATASMVRGDYLYFHYLCDGTDDRVRHRGETLVILPP